jgi:hypothetical protein
MAAISSILFVLLLLTSCGDSGGYHRSYIISEGEEEEMVSEPEEKRQI